MKYVRTMQGLGDAFAARPTIAALLEQGGVLLETAWPEAFDFGEWAEPLGLHFVRPDPSSLTVSCARENAAASTAEWYDLPADAGPALQLGYTLQPGCRPIPEQIAASAGVVPDWKLFFAPVCCQHGIGVFRLPTLRAEYFNRARNPEAGVVSEAVELIGGDWIHVNRLEENKEFLDGDIAPFCAHATATKGQLALSSVLTLLNGARACVTPMCWMAWAAACYQVPTLILWGGFCRPETIFGPLVQDMRIAAPDPICDCFDRGHSCRKDISPNAFQKAVTDFGGSLK